MHHYQNILPRIISILILLFAIWNVASQFIDFAFSDSAGLNSAQKIFCVFVYLNLAIILAMGILSFFSKYRGIFITAIVLALIGIIFWITEWNYWGSASTINIIFLIIVLAFDCWQFITNRSDTIKVNNNKVH